LTDEMARRIRGGGGSSVVGYNVQVAVDEKHKLIFGQRPGKSPVRMEPDDPGL
jgi:hypothetical protein